MISEAFTLLERRGELDGLHLTFVGEDTNLCRSWCELTTIFDLSVTQVCPPGWELPATFLESLRQHGQVGRVAVTHDLQMGAAVLARGRVAAGAWRRSGAARAWSSASLMAVASR